MLWFLIGGWMCLSERQFLNRGLNAYKWQAQNTKNGRVLFLVCNLPAREFYDLLVWMQWILWEAWLTCCGPGEGEDDILPHICDEVMNPSVDDLPDPRVKAIDEVMPENWSAKLPKLLPLRKLWCCWRWWLWLGRDESDRALLLLLMLPPLAMPWWCDGTGECECIIGFRSSARKRNKQKLIFWSKLYLNKAIYFCIWYFCVWYCKQMNIQHITQNTKCSYVYIISCYNLSGHANDWILQKNIENTVDR